ncbi:hypothetical protein WMY93_021572 [Mugilogobius chulae]|uniref:Integrase catalytic domain-containing protein n=1 Tax=Mugilogobius chulae TaxID=88201 RepID=A0AAW0NG23_9GOBI
MNLSLDVDPTAQFLVEVDASDSGLGAVLSQRSSGDKKLHPCAFYSRQLTPAERNYDVGNRELLAVVEALKEWRHWLEGSAQPFLVWTDHKNLSYLRSARRLNSRQARWALFLGRFNFTLTYRPGSRNIKPDALSRQLALTVDSSEEPILPPACVIGAAAWDVEKTVQEALVNQPSPDGCPRVVCLCLNLPGLRFSSGVIRLKLPAILVSTAPLPFFSSASGGHQCPQTPRSLLQPVQSVPVVNRLTVLQLVFFVHFLFLTAHGRTSQSILGPQFSSQVWKAFCRALGASASLSSGYHPQTNGQTERANQDLEAALRCVTSRHPASWSVHLPWIEYSHNSLVSSATGMSPFMAANGFQPPLFPSQESQVSVPSIQRHLQRARRIWHEVRAALSRTAERNQRLADRRRSPAPEYKSGQKVWLSTRDLPCRRSPRNCRPASESVTVQMRCSSDKHLLDTRPTSLSRIGLSWSC